MDAVNIKVTPVAAEVYRQGCTITSRGEATLMQGANRMIIEGLPEGFDEGSVQLRVPAGITLGQVRVLRESGDSASADDPLDQTLDDLDRQIENKQLELTSWQELAAKMGGPAALDYLERLPKTLDRLSRELYDLRAERRRLANDRDAARCRQRRSRLEAQAEADHTGTCRIELVCRSARAGWTPSYDVLVDGLDQPLCLRLKGEVWQQTGDDWCDVALRLSTGTAAVLGDLPRFAPRYLRRSEPEVMERASGLPRAGMPAPLSLGSGMARMPAPSASDTFADSFDELFELREPEATVDEQATVTVYELVGSQNLRSDREPQTLSVVTTELSASYRYYSYPRKEEAAYLVAHLDSEPPAAVLEQPLAVYLAGSYAGSVRVGRTADDEGYELPLGRDERIRVRRIEDVQRSKRRLGSKLCREHRCRITVENHKNETVTLVVLEQVPLSRDKDIEVVLNDAGGAAYDAERGELRWEHTIEPEGRLQLSAAYGVTHPKGFVLQQSEQTTAVPLRPSGHGGFCPRCGARVSDGERFCPSCGGTLA